jgi:hypothetical protein
MRDLRQPVGIATGKDKLGEDEAVKGATCTTTRSTPNSQNSPRLPLRTRTASAPLISPFGPLSEPQNVIGDRRTTSCASTNKSNFQLEGDRMYVARVSVGGGWESPHQENPTRLIKTYNQLILFIYFTYTKDPRQVRCGAAALCSPISFIHSRGPTHIL